MTKFGYQIPKNGERFEDVGEATQLLAQHAGKLSSVATAIDIGCGSGYLSLCLRSQGILADGVDINPDAVALAMKNAEAQKLDCQFFVSDLFANVQKKYDLIIFNPPVGSVSSGRGNRILERLKSFIPKGTVLTKIAYPLIRRSRRALIRRFLADADRYLTPNGYTLLHLDRRELDLLQGRKYTILDRYMTGNTVLINGTGVGGQVQTDVFSTI